MAKNQASGGKNRKYGRNKVKCAAYRAAGTREFNKARKAAKIVRRLAKKAKKLAV